MCQRRIIAGRDGERATHVLGFDDVDEDEDSLEGEPAGIDQLRLRSARGALSLPRPLYDSRSISIRGCHERAISSARETRRTGATDAFSAMGFTYLCTGMSRGQRGAGKRRARRADALVEDQGQRDGEAEHGEALRADGEG